MLLWLKTALRQRNSRKHHHVERKVARQRNYQPRVEGLEERTLLDGGGVAPPAGVVSWWDGDDTFEDLLNRNDGVQQGNVAFTAGMVGSGFSFDGTSFVRVADSSSLDLSGEITLEFWFKYHDANQFYGIIAKRTDVGFPIANYGVNFHAATGIGLYFNDPNLYGGGDDPPPYEVVRAPLPTAHEFHHFAGTFRQVDPTHVELSMFIDGALVDRIVVGGNLQNAQHDAPLTIGASSADGPNGIERFVGVIDEVTLYNRALTDEEIQGIYQAGGEGKIKSTIACDDAAVVDEDGTVAIDVLANDISPFGDPFHPAAVTGPAHGTITLNADGTFSYTPQANFFGADSFTYRAADDSNVATVSITVNSVNDAPVLAAVGSKSVNEGSLLSFTLSATDVEGDSLTFSLVSGPAGATVTPDGVFSFTPADGPASFDITVQVSDGQDADSETFNVSVNNVAPTVEAGSDEIIAHHTTFIRKGSFADPGADFWIGTVNFGDGTGDQALTLNSDHTFVLTHDYFKKGVYTVTVTVADDDGGIGVDTFVVEVLPPGQVDGGDGSILRSKKNITRFFSLFGDANGDGKVNKKDAGNLFAAFGKSQGDDGFLWFFDYDGDGQVG